MSTFRRTTALVALLAYLALSTVGAGWVVCTGANGHVAIESLAAGCCSAGEVVEAHDHHDACEDTVIVDTACHDDDHDCVHDLDADVHAHIGCGDCNDCGDCDDVALSDLTQARLSSIDTSPTLPVALPVRPLPVVAHFLDIERTFVTPDVAPRPPPERALLACTMLRL